MLGKHRPGDFCSLVIGMGGVASPPIALFLRLEHHDLAVCRHSSLAIAAPGSLGDGFQRSEGAIDLGEIHVHASLDALGGNQATRFPMLESCTYPIQYNPPMLRAEVGREMKYAVCLFELIQQGERVALQVHYHQYLIHSANLSGQL